MKKIIFKISFVFLIFSCELNTNNTVENDKYIYHDNELISMVYMTVNNKTKSEKKIEKLSLRKKSEISEEIVDRIVAQFN